MGNRQSDGLLQSLSKLVGSQTAQLTDGQLLQRFAAHRDDEAFAALLQRHGGLVYRVCRNILRHDHDAEDAFQGTFLVFARRAGAIQEEKAIESWLYRVAYRIAMKARKAAERRRQREEQTAKPPDDRPASDLGWRELQAMLDEELNRLPEKYRTPFVLCCLTGKSKSEAAAELGWKEGTVSSRLAQARKLLQSRLARRGVALSVVLSGLAIARDGTAAAIPAELLAATRKAALAFAAGEAPAAAVPVALARGVLRGTTLARWAVAGVAVAVVGLIGSAAVVAFHQPEPPPTPDLARAVAAAPTPPQKPLNVPNDANPGNRMTVAGSVVGPDGQPVPGARVAVAAVQYRRPGELYPDRLKMTVIGEGHADDQGRFQLAATQTRAENYRLTALASAPGYALSGTMADPATVTASEHTLPLELIRGRAVRVRLVDQTGQPAKGVTAHILGLSRGGRSGIDVLYYEPPVTIPGWPDAATTDDDGCFTLRDIGPQTQVSFQVRDERFAVEWLTFRTGLLEQTKPVVIALSPARTLEGRLTAQDTGLPIPDATIVVETYRENGGPSGLVEARTDAEGRYRLRPFPGKRLQAWVYPPPEQPYLVLLKDLEWPGDATRHQADLIAPRGVLVRGTVREAGSDRPIAGAAVRYDWSYKDNPFRKQQMGGVGVQWRTHDARTGPDGMFTLAVPPGPGTLLVKAAEPDYVHVETSSGQLLDGAVAGGTPYFADALVPMRLTLASGVQYPTILLRRGVTLRGRVLGHDGQPVASARMFSPTYVPEGWELKGHPLPVRDGRFELPGCAPGAKLTLCFYDSLKKEAALANVTVDANAEPTVQLVPCVSARLRFVDDAGKLVSPSRISMELVFRPGDSINDSLQWHTQVCLTIWTSWIYGRDYTPVEMKTGEYLLPDLIPGAMYNVRVEGRGVRFGPVSFMAPPAGSTDPAAITVGPRPATPPKK